MTKEAWSYFVLICLPGFLTSSNNIDLQNTDMQFACSRHFVLQHCIILPWSVPCSNCIMLWWSHPDSNDGRISALHSINSRVPYPGTIDSRKWRPPAGVGGKTSSLGILSSKVPVPQLAVSHIPVSGCSATKQTECVHFSTYIFNVITGLNGNEN